MLDDATAVATTAALASLPPPVAAGLRVILAGPPGAGKTTHGLRLAEAFHVPHISMGNLLRDEVRRGTEIGKQVAPYLESGNLVPIEISRVVMAQRLQQPDAAEGFILDGFPRRSEDVRLLDEIRKDQGIPEVAMLLIDVPDDEIVGRVANRRVCQQGHTVDIKLTPPRQEGLCDQDGSALARRPDDDPEIVRHRLDVYHAETTPMVALYGERGLLHAVSGSGPIEAVALRVMQEAREIAGARA